ncbi:MAG: nitroreductase family protein [Planctomycetes bacterium]|nr:nitroreductase family protein [Planctomycetota bacterium]
MDALEALKTRRSVRVFKSNPIPGKVIEDLIDCGRMAPTAINIQPWEFIAVTDAALRARIAGATDHGDFIKAAPLCIAVFCKDTKYYLEDGCNASVCILVAARAHGLGGCWVAGDKKPYAGKIGEMLGSPAGCKLISLLAIGYPAEQPLAAKRPLSEVLHWERF